LTVKRDANFIEEVPVAKKLSAETLEKLKAIYEECEDGAHGCMGIPSGCIQSYLEQKDSENPPTCSVMVAWEKAGDKNVYKLTGTTDGDSGYVAVGFSNDNKMVSIFSQNSHK